MAWKAPRNNGHKDDDSSFPGLKDPGAATRIEYDELQRNELVALEAIYGDDFVKHSGAHGAWKKSEPSFDIHIKASSDSDIAVSVGFVMTATYPKTPPILTIKGLENLREATQFKVNKFIETQPVAFAKLEEEMIDKIVEGVRDILEDAAQAKATGKQLPSLEEERKRHEAKIARLAQEQEEQEERKKLQAEREEERVMSEKLQQQLDHQRQKAKESKLSRGLAPGQPTESAGADFERVDFDQFCDATDRDGNVASFCSVIGKYDPRQGPVSVVYTVIPIPVNGQSSQTMALKEAILRSIGNDSKALKKQIQSLESRLEDLKAAKGVRHHGIVHVLNFKIQSGLPSDPAAPNAWTVRILSPLADKGSLEDLLELAGSIEISKVKSWTRDLLDALNYLHTRGITHQDIHPRNVLLFRGSTGEIVPKISDAWYQREMHNASAPKRGLPGLSSAKSAYWLPPEIAGASKPQYSHKTDIWDFGVVFIQMLFGLDVLQTYSSPRNLIDSLNLSQSFLELVGHFFKEDKQKRYRAFELVSSEFLATDAPVFFDDGSGVLPAAQPTALSQALPAKLRRNSVVQNAVVSRYAENFVEVGRLGKGGFGEVVKARKKLDGQIYAIKKISPRSEESLSDILKEVQLLSQLSHPAVVRYYDTWVEGVPLTGDEGDSSDEETDDDYPDYGTELAEDDDIHIEFAPDSDFIASTNGPVDAASDSEGDDKVADEEDEGEDVDETSSTAEDVEDSISTAQTENLTKSRRREKVILYISMEYCEKRTLRDLISRNLFKNTAEIWRLFRQILEGLAHIHERSIVHRDLKPENIFLGSSIDGADNVKIGDFGLATSGQFSVDPAAANSSAIGDMTRSIGTTFYAAPEVSSAAKGHYSTKVDMYSLGIIFFEMCYEPMLGMQKADVLGQLRRPTPVLPADFKPAEETQTEIVLSLVDHDPSRRPSSAELLKSGKLPVQMESETIRRILASMSDPSSPYYGKMLSTLFARPVEATKDYAWDMLANAPDPAELLYQESVKNVLTSIFRRHGALEVSRSPIYPRSAHYGDSVVQLLDPDGTVLQLPYDLTMGHARMVAKQTTAIERAYTFASVFRDRKNTGQPQVFGEVDFDIVTSDALDLALKEAEVLKVLDEIVWAFPSLSSGQMCLHLGHSDLLQLIFEHCGIEPARRKTTADVLSKLNIQKNSWKKIRMELRSPAVGLSATSVDELEQFDFRDTPNKAFSKLKGLLGGRDMYNRASSTIAHLKEVLQYAKRFGVATRIHINPLSSLKEDFYVGGILFSCINDKKMEIVAAGGRYDHLIKEHRPRIGGQPEKRHAVGFRLAWERLAKAPKSGGKSSQRKTEGEANSITSGRRCDALVASFDVAVLRSTGIEILRLLWANDISAQLAGDAKSPEDLLSKHRQENYSWIIMIKQDSMLKIKTMSRNDVADVDIPTAQLLAWLRPQMRERDSKASRGARGSSAGAEREHEQEVKVLVAQTKSKKVNRHAVVEQAQVSAASLVQSFLKGPILAVEATDAVMDLVAETVLSKHETWRAAEERAPTAEKKYVREMEDQLKIWRSAYEEGKGSKHSFMYNFRTGTCLYYDLSG